MAAVCLMARLFTCRRFRCAAAAFVCAVALGSVGHAAGADEDEGEQARERLTAGWRVVTSTLGYCVRGNHKACQERLGAFFESRGPAAETAPAPAAPAVRVGMFMHPAAMSFYLLKELMASGSCDSASRTWRAPVQVPDDTLDSAVTRLIREADDELSDRARWPAENRQLAEWRRTIDACHSR
jgi:hypothetical protein